MGSKTWIIPVTWSMCGTVTVSADTLEEAVETIKNEEDGIPLPADGEYVDSSWELSFSETDLIRELYNDNQADTPSEKGFKHGQGTESQSNHT
ncbi:MAG: hypothetical protein DBY04_01060 [Clostridiales bacterium]|nr:MAG: hypothetical protein DBY04_01060 [Clostridiales bacterium]